MSAPEKVTAYELALRLHGMTMTGVLSKETRDLAASNRLIVCYPRWDVKDPSSLAIGFLGAKNGCCQNQSNEILDGCRVLLVHFIQEIGFRIVADIPSVSFLMKDDRGYDEAFGLVIDMSVFDDLEREAAEKRDDGAL